MQRAKAAEAAAKQAAQDVQAVVTAAKKIEKEWCTVKAKKKTTEQRVRLLSSQPHL